MNRRSFLPALALFPLAITKKPEVDQMPSDPATFRMKGPDGKWHSILLDPKPCEDHRPELNLRLR